MSFHHRRKSFPENVTPEKVTPKPPPVVPPVTRRALSGLWVYSGWQNPRKEWGAVPYVMCRAENPWRTLETDDRKMALGEYDEADPQTYLTRLEGWKRGKFDFVVHQLEHAHEHTNPAKRASNRPVLNDWLTMSHNADNHAALPATGIKFCVDWWDVMAAENVWRNDTIWQEMIGNGWNADDVRNSHKLFAGSVATRYMRHADYLHIEDRPVLFRGAPQELQFYADHFSVQPEEIVSIWRDEIKKQTGKDVYLMATAVDPPFRENLHRLGFQGFAEYLLHGNGWANTMDVYRDWWAKDIAQAKRDGLSVWISGTVGYDGAAWNTPEFQRGVGHMPTPAEFEAHVKEVQKVAVENSDVTGAISIYYADNEIGEGGIAQPMADIPGNLHRGDEMLLAHRAAVT